MEADFEGGSSEGEWRREFPGLVLDFRARLAWVDGIRLELTKVELDLLAELSRLPGVVRSPADLLQAVWHTAWPGDDHLVEVTISRLRSKLGERASAPRFIHTARGIGYRFEAEDAGADSDGAQVRQPAATVPGTSPPHVSFLVNAARQIEWVGSEVTDVLGWQPRQLVGTNIYDLLHSSEIVRLPPKRAKVEQGQTVGGIFQTRCADGRCIPMHFTVQPVMQGGSLVQIYVRIEAIADELRLHYDRELTLRAVTPHAPFLGWQPDDVIGTCFMLAAELGDSFDRDTLLKWMHRLSASGPPESTRSQLVRRADGDTQLASVSTLILVDDQRRFDGLIGTVVLDGGQTGN